ncbi:MAG TPA: dihydroxyacetone kinase subunit L [Anaerolineae bacterium]|nr:dihydroxyacetone kinase subunit L [Anaerolineae bacterium]
MKSSLSIEQTKEMMIFVSKHIIKKKDELNKADKVLGDGDHGKAMTRGFEAVITKLENEQFADLKNLLRYIGNVLLDSVGGAAGIIFGTLFRSGSKGITNTLILDSSEFSNFLGHAVEAIKLRGNVKIGDKTMLDALGPASKIAAESIDLPIAASMKKASEVAYKGMESTKSIPARIGRAKILGDRSIGHPDPGAISTYYILKYMSDYVNKAELND